MIRTSVRATASRRPEWGGLSSKARAVPEYLTVATRPLTARNFLVRPKHRLTVGREERSCGTGVGTQVKAAIVRFYSAYHRPETRKDGKMVNTHCMGSLKLLSGWEAVWPHHTLFPATGHKSLTFTTMVFPNGPVKDGEYGSEVGVILKQRPQAPPAALLAPNASSLTAAEYPFTVWPHAAGRHRAQRVITMMNVDGFTYRQLGNRRTR
jgi:hypothetical protein